MAKDPAVLWYTSDFLTGTNHFTHEEIGLYIRLLAHQHQQGPLSLEFIERIAGRRFSKLWPVIKSKFAADLDGFFFNERMQVEVLKRKEHSLKQQQKAVKRWETRGNATAYPAADATGMPLENEDENRKGGTGERDENWEGVKTQFLMHTAWMTNFCLSKNLTPTQFDRIAQDFVTNLDLKEEYKSLKEVKSHFTNWFNKDKTKILAGLVEQKNGVSAREIEEQKNREKLGIHD